MTAGVTGKTASEEESNLLDGVVGVVGEIAQGSGIIAYSVEVTVGTHQGNVAWLFARTCQGKGPPGGTEPPE